MEAVGADGLTNDQWVKATSQGANKGLANDYKEQNKEKEKETQNSTTIAGQSRRRRAPALCLTFTTLNIFEYSIF